MFQINFFEGVFHEKVYLLSFCGATASGGCFFRRQESGVKRPGGPNRAGGNYFFP
jgi:hypothetical protein